MERAGNQSRGPGEVLLPTLAALGFVVVVSSIISLGSLTARPGQTRGGHPAGPWSGRGRRDF